METMAMNATGTVTVEPVKTRKASIARKLMTAGMCANAMVGATALTAVTAFADGNEWNESVGISDSGGSATGIMGNVIGILLTITRYVGVALVVYGVYEVVMSFMQNQPEAKTKGIIMALAGAVMVGLKSVLEAMGVITGSKVRK